MPVRLLKCGGLGRDAGITQAGRERPGDDRKAVRGDTGPDQGAREETLRGNSGNGILGKGGSEDLTRQAALLHDVASGVALLPVRVA